MRIPDPEAPIHPGREGPRAVRAGAVRPGSGTDRRALPGRVRAGRVWGLWGGGLRDLGRVRFPVLGGDAIRARPLDAPSRGRRGGAGDDVGALLRAADPAGRDPPRLAAGRDRAGADRGPGLARPGAGGGALGGGRAGPALPLAALRPVGGAVLGASLSSRGAGGGDPPLLALAFPVGSARGRWWGLWPALMLSTAVFWAWRQPAAHAFGGRGPRPTEGGRRACSGRRSCSGGRRRRRRRARRGWRCSSGRCSPSPPGRSAGST